VEKEQLSLLFRILKNPVRRQILLMLNEHKEITAGEAVRLAAHCPQRGKHKKYLNRVLTYHLVKLTELRIVERRDAAYSLTTLGRTACNLLVDATRISCGSRGQGDRSQIAG